MRLSMLGPPLPGEVRQSWGFDLIRIQLPHPHETYTRGVPGDLTGHALRAFRMRTLGIQYPDPCGKPAIPGGGGWGVGANIDRCIIDRSSKKYSSYNYT